MIDVALNLIRDELADFLANRMSYGTNSNVIVNNVGLFETSDGSDIDRHILITLVNIEEESTLKNQPALKRPFGDFAIYENPPVFLNLYVLFACNFKEDYEDGLRRLSIIIQFFQSKNSFSTASSVSGGSIISGITDVLNLKFTMELYTLTFEQINHLWGSLGGRQMPFAMYKLRLVAITERATVREVPLIEEIETISHPLS